MSEPGPADPRQERAGDRPPRPAAAGHLIGRVAASTTRVDPGRRDVDGETTLSFRLLGPDGQEPREVQLRGYSISGTVRDGDWVEVDERERSGRLDVLLLLDLTTGTEVRVVGRSSFRAGPLLRLALILVVVVIVLLLVWIGLGLLGVVDDGWLFGPDGLFGGGPDGRLDPGST